MKTGWKTTEFWLSAAATVLGLVTASGAFSETGTVAKVVGLVVSGLAALGYTASRTALKADQTV